MSLKWRFITVRSLCLLGLTAGSLVFAQDKAVATSDQAAPRANKESPGQTKASGKPKAEGDPSKEGGPSGGERRKPGGDAADKTAYDFELPGGDGKAVSLSDFKGKILLIVNLARKSSYGSQLAGLQKLSETYKDRGVIVIGVPSNEFGAAEPGTDAEIQKFYKVDNKVTFPIMAKSALTGDAKLPFYAYLTTGKSVPEGGGVPWNYTKFLIDKTGKVVARFSSDVGPDSNELLATLEEVLDGTYKPKRAGGANGAGGGDGPPN